MAAVPVAGKGSAMVVPESCDGELSATLGVLLLEMVLSTGGVGAGTEEGNAVLFTVPRGVGAGGVHKGRAGSGRAMLKGLSGLDMAREPTQLCWL
jgi:hypothetical protein